MKVICAGFSHTGTKSLAEALRILGYPNIHDFLEHSAIDGHHWKKIFDGRGSLDDFKKIYKEVDAVVDVPANLFWEEILQAFPDAKVILTLRQSEEEWYKSFAKYISHIRTSIFWENRTCISVGVFLMKLFMPSYHRYFHNVCTAGYGYLIGYPNNELLLRNHYRRHNRNVLNGCPSDKLLVFNVEDGWGPLCKFLGAKEPTDVPFPKKNQRRESFVVKFFQGKYQNDGGMRQKMMDELYSRVTLFVSLVIVPSFVMITMSLGLL